MWVSVFFEKIPERGQMPLIVVQHLKRLWHHVSIVDNCCGQFGGGEIGF